MTEQHAYELMALIAAFYPREELPEESQEVWLRKFQGIEIQDATQAAEEVTRTCRRWPSWAEFSAAHSRALSDRLEQANEILKLGPDHRKGPMAPYTKRMGEYVKATGEKAVTQGEAIDRLHTEFGCPAHGIKGTHCRPCYNENVDVDYRR